MRAASSSSRWAVGSSRIRKRASESRARARASRWRWPPESSEPSAPTGVSRPAGSAATQSSSSTVSSAPASSSSPASRRPISRFSRIVVLNRCASWPHEQDGAAQLGLGELAEVDAVEAHRARARGRGSARAARPGCSCRSRWARDGDAFAGPSARSNVLEQPRLLRAVAESRDAPRAASRLRTARRGVAGSATAGGRLADLLRRGPRPARRHAGCGRPPAAAPRPRRRPRKRKASAASSTPASAPPVDAVDADEQHRQQARGRDHSAERLGQRDGQPVAAGEPRSSPSSRSQALDLLARRGRTSASSSAPSIDCDQLAQQARPDGALAAVRAAAGERRQPGHGDRRSHQGEQRARAPAAGSISHAARAAPAITQQRHGGRDQRAQVEVRRACRRRPRSGPAARPARRRSSPGHERREPLVEADPQPASWRRARSCEASRSP